jgi:hypothetical protein
MPQYRVHFEQSVREEVTIYVEAATREAAEREARHRDLKENFDWVFAYSLDTPEVIAIEEIVPASELSSP